MNAKELMIGDWVINPAHKDYSRIEGVYYDKELHCLVATDGRFPQEYFDPIPLTPKILEKNGLDKVPELSMVINRDTMPMYHSPMLHYVHELQHALRLCGLNVLADNFKVE